MSTDRPPSNGNGHDPEAEEGSGFGEFEVPVRRDILENEEDVTDVSNRDLIIRAVNASLAAKAIATKVDDAVIAIQTLSAKIDALTTLFAEVIASRPHQG